MGGGWQKGNEGKKGVSYVKNVRVSFTYCIVANKIRLMSIWSREKCACK